MRARIGQAASINLPPPQGHTQSHAPAVQCQCNASRRADS